MLKPEGYGLRLPPSEGTPVYGYDLAWPEDQSWPSDERARQKLEDWAWPEPLTVEKLEGKAGKIMIRTTPHGRDELRKHGMVLTGPEDDTDAPRCTNFFVSFAIDAARRPAESVKLWAQKPCPDAQIVRPHNTLLVQGLGARDRSLFLAVSVDPRWQIHETADEKGQMRLVDMGRKPATSTYVDFTAPTLGERLRAIRIWQLDAKGEGVPIATIMLDPTQKSRE